MSGPPSTKTVECPACAAMAHAVVPSNSTPIQNETVDDGDVDGKVWTTCSFCDERFLVYYRLDT